MRIAVHALLASLAAAGAAAGQSMDIVLVIDRTASMEAQIDVIRLGWPGFVDTLETGGIDARYGLILSDGACALAQDLVDGPTFLDPAGPFQTFAIGAGDGENFATALRDCGPTVSWRPARPRYVYLFRDDGDDESTPAERDAAVAAAVSGFGAFPMTVLTVDLPGLPNLLDLAQRASCATSTEDVFYFVATLPQEIASLPPGPFDATTWPCAPIFADGVESGDTGEWSAVFPRTTGRRSR